MSLVEGALNKLYSIAVSCCFFTNPVNNTQYNDNFIDELKSLLNSQRIEKIFGSYGVNILYQDDKLRVTNLYSSKDKTNIMRTCAIVNYRHPVNDVLTNAHKEILSGGSIGAVLKKAGFAITKVPIYFGAIDLPLIAKKQMGTDLDSAAVHIYSLKIKSEENNLETDYCTIIEIHSPEYLNNQSLSQLYPHEYARYNVITDKVKPYIERVEHIDTLLSKTPSLT